MRHGDRSATRPACRLGLLGWSLTACTRVSDHDPFPATDAELEIVSTVPAAGAMDVEPTSEVDICLSGLVDPRRIDDFDVTLSSGPIQVDTELSFQLVPWRAPGGGPLLPADALAPWCPGSVLAITPKRALVEGILYRIRVRPTAVGWEGERLDDEGEGWVEEEDVGRVFYLEFTTALPSTTDGTATETGATETGATETGATDGGTGGSTSGGEGGTDSDGGPGPGLSRLFAAGSVFDPTTPGCRCHRDPEELAHALLDLTTPATAFSDLVGPARTRDTGFPMISPRRPSESFLLHKLLRHDGRAIHGVLGDPMPPDRPLPYADLVSIARWIEDGAEP